MTNQSQHFQASMRGDFGEAFEADRATSEDWPRDLDASDYATEANLQVHAFKLECENFDRR